VESEHRCISCINLLHEASVYTRRNRFITRMQDAITYNAVAINPDENTIIPATFQHGDSLKLNSPKPM
jgi:hypothetical protein